MKILELQEVPLPKYYTQRQSFLLSKIGIFTIEDLLVHIPFRYEDRSKITNLANAILQQEIVVVRVKIINHQTFYWNKKACVKIIIQDNSASAELVSFNIKALHKMMPIGQEFYIYTKFEFRYNKIQSSNFEFESLEKFGSKHSILGKIIPIYRLTDGLRIKEFYKIIQKAFALFDNQIHDPVPKYFLEHRKLLSKLDSLVELHFPTDFKKLEKARTRGAYEEFLCIRLSLEIKRLQETKVIKPHSYPISIEIEKLHDILPFQMTNAQIRVINEIITDLQKPHSMHRLVHGDVGAGKTTVALVAMILAAKNNLQIAFLAPTEVLAFQHYKKLVLLLEKLKIPCALLTGSFTNKERRPILEGLKNGSLPIVIGTHALFQEEVIYKNLSLVIIDEQHKFGVEQRGMLINKGIHPDILVMTATPIPRTISQTFYGDLEISVIDELPKGRQEIITSIISPHQYPQMLQTVSNEITKEHQAFIICPLIEENEKLSKVRSIEQVYEEYQQKFPHFTFALIHGKMSQDEKDSIMNEFAQNKIQILIATTVIEVGIDIPNATIMIIENAERFGLAQLHQLRGRIGRGQYKSYCFAINYGYNNTKLNIFGSTNNGFIIAEEDLKIRGPGDLLGTRQTGTPIFKLANFSKDQKILQAAINDIQLILNKDPHLEFPIHKSLKEFLILNHHLRIFSG